MSKRLISLVSTATLVLGGATALVAPAGAAPPTAPSAAKHGCNTGAMDFDGNGGTDLAIGAPRHYHRGEVVVEMKHVGGPRRVVVHPPKGASTSKWGRAVGDVDLSRHTDPAKPCSDLVIGAPSAVYIYRWSRKQDRFMLLSRITKAQIPTPHGTKLKGFGASLATQTERGNRPAARKPVLYVGAPFSRDHSRGWGGAVVRLVLTHHGKVASSSVISPVPAGRTTSRMPMSLRMAYHFGIAMIGTPSPNEIIVGDERANRANGTGEDVGAALVWRRFGGSQLLTEKRLIAAAPKGPLTKEHDLDTFGHALYLSTALAAQAGTRPKLYVAAPGASSGRHSNGAVFQLPFDKDGRVAIAHTKVWTPKSRGVNRKRAHSIGGALGGILGAGGNPRIVTGAGSRNGGLAVLGTGQYFDARDLGVRGKHLRAVDGASIGDVIGDWQDRKDHLKHDRWPGSDPASYQHRFVTSGDSDSLVVSGLPMKGAGRVVHFRLKGCVNPQTYCEFGRSLTSSAGGGTSSYLYG